MGHPFAAPVQYTYQTVQKSAVHELAKGQMIGIGFKQGKPKNDSTPSNTALQGKRETCSTCGCGAFCTECGAPLQLADTATPSSGVSTPEHHMSWVPQPLMMQNFVPYGEHCYAGASDSLPPQNQQTQSSSQMQAFQ